MGCHLCEFCDFYDFIVLMISQITKMTFVRLICELEITNCDLQNYCDICEKIGILRTTHAGNMNIIWIDLEFKIT